MNSFVCFTPKDFAIKIDDNTLEFASPVADSQGRRRSAQIKVLTDCTLLKDNKERYSADERSVTWSDDIDDFVIEKLGNKPNLSEQLLTTLEVSTILGVSKSQICNYVKQGKLKPVISNSGGNWYLKNDIIIHFNEKIQKLQLTLDRISEYKE
ncbi:MAG: helix-turn-helix domain-containing protein [Hungatella sp.]|nr:helix-turn-helix domain-containing protein [Hungatella sp.]